VHDPQLINSYICTTADVVHNPQLINSYIYTTADRCALTSADQELYTLITQLSVAPEHQLINTYIG
jgi:hypothetical protein